MNITASRAVLSGSVTVPGSKSHTIRALLLASLADGVSHIANPLPSEDCLSTAHAVPLLGAHVELTPSLWTVTGAGSSIHLPSDVVNVGDSGSLLYFMTPIAATFPGWSIFTGDESIRKRPVSHLADALRQLGAQAYISRPDADGCPLVIGGPVTAQHPVTTGGELSQYVSGMMMAATRMNGTLYIELTNPKETPYLTMTKQWLQSLGVPVTVSDDFHHISVTGPVALHAFDRTIPSDWEAVAFPLVAALVSGSSISITNIDGSGSQGDDAIVAVLNAAGAGIIWDRKLCTLTVPPGRKRLSGNQHINLSGFPDAVCALAAAACFIEGTTVLEDISVCRRKETDRIVVLREELTKLGAVVEEGPDFLTIHGHSPLTADGNPNPEFCLHGATVQSYHDHRVAMALACLGLGLPAGASVVVCDAECCAVSFPRFFDVMNEIGAGFVSSND
jgi:3-phosphoshikimate 1-carboxyvinyltransferase